MKKYQNSEMLINKRLKITWHKTVFAMTFLGHEFGQSFQPTSALRVDTEVFQFSCVTCCLVRLLQIHCLR